MARVNNFSFAEDLAKERQRFSRENFSKEAEGGGLLLFPNTYDDIKQINYNPYSIDPKERELIQTNVFNYFGVNEDVLQNKLNGDTWNAFYEGAIEPFAVQFSDVFSRILFTQNERLNGSRMIATANRMQYMNSKTKLDMIAQFMDRGIFTINEARAILNLDPVEGGDVRTVRGEYKNADDVNTSEVGNDDTGNIAEN
jgi:phage portal protein BeeE